MDRARLLLASTVAVLLLAIATPTSAQSQKITSSLIGPFSGSFTVDYSQSPGNPCSPQTDNVTFTGNYLQFANDPRLRYFRGEYHEWLAGRADSRLNTWSANDFDVQQELFVFFKRSVGAMFRAGIPMLAGTDAGNAYCFPGFSLHDELALLVESGLTPLAALQAATRNAAIFMNAADRYGSISKGKVADLVLLDTDPLQDIHNTTKISEVFLNGKEFDRAALDLILKNAEQEANAPEGTSYGAGPLPEQENVKATFISANQTAAALNKPKDIPGGTSAELANGPGYRMLVARRTAPASAELHNAWTDIWYVTSGGGVLVTGGSLTDPVESQGGDLYGRTIQGGEEHRIDKGDLITIPAGVPHWVRSINAPEIVYLVLKASSRPGTGSSRATFVSARQIQLAGHEIAGSNGSLRAAAFDDTPAYSTGLARRTAAGRADVHSSWTDVWWVVKGSGVLVSGGSLINSQQSTPGEFRGTGIIGGEEHHIAAGDLVVIPAGVPHWVKAVDRPEIVYIDPKVASPDTANLTAQPPPEMQSLAKAFEGTWSVEEQYEPSELLPQGRRGHATQIWRRGPGGFTFMEEFRGDNLTGEFGLALMWWDKTTGFRNTGAWCDKTMPKSCMVFVNDPSASFQWDGKQQVINNEFQQNGKTYSYHEVLTDITPTSFLQTIDIGEKGRPLKRFLTIHATRMAGEPQLSSQVSSRDIASASPEMQRLFQAFQGRWSYRVDRENGQPGAGEQIWRAGPGGVELIEELKGAHGGPFGLSVTWWDAVAKGYRAVWCDNTLSTGCIVMSKLAQWEGADFVLRDQFERNGKTFDYKEVVSDITPTSYTQTIYQGEAGSESKRALTIHATKIAEGEQNHEQAQKLTMPGPDVQNLMLGTWAIRVKYPPSSDQSNGDTGEGSETWRPGPGGRSVIEEYRERNAKGEAEGLGVAWWDKQAQGQRFVWCDNSNPDGCYVSKEVAKWNGPHLVWTEEQNNAGKSRVYSEIFKDITPDSFIQVLQEGEPGEPLKNTAIISAKRSEAFTAGPAMQGPLPSPATTFEGGNAVPTAAAPSLTGKMAIYNALLGGPWNCTAELPTMSGQPAHTETNKVTFSVAPQNVLLIEVSSSQFAGRNFIGFDSKSNQYWRTEMGVFGGIMRETSADGANFSGKSTMGETWEPVRSVLTAVKPDGSSSDTEWWTRNGIELKITSHCMREAPIHDISTDSAETELRAFMAESRRANIEGDLETAANSLTDDYVQTDINGYRQDKTTWLNQYFKPLADLIKAGKFHWDEYERKNVEFHFYGDCAVVTGDLQAKGTGARFGSQHTWVADPHATFSGTLHFTHVYIKRNGKWLLAALHNQIPLPPGNPSK